MERLELATEISNLLEQQAQCVLATIDDVSPCQHLMAYAFSEDLFSIYLATYMDTRKFRNMLSNPQVSLMWDNRKGNIQDHIDGYSLSATGQAYLLGGQAQEDARQAILLRNSTLDRFLSQADCRFFSINLKEYILTKGYDRIFHFNSN